jgi:hypothetical protein
MSVAEAHIVEALRTAGGRRDGKLAGVGAPLTWAPKS